MQIKYKSNKIMIHIYMHAWTVYNRQSIHIFQPKLFIYRMLANESFARFQGGANVNSLFNILQLNEASVVGNQPTRHSSYYDFDNCKLLAERNKERFNILNSNIEPNAKFSEFEAFSEELNRIKLTFSLICLQERCLSDNDDLSHLHIEGYHCITQDKTCSNKGGVVIYLNNKFNFKVMLFLNQFQYWEGHYQNNWWWALKIYYN